MPAGRNASCIIFILAYGEELIDRAAWVSDGLASRVAKILPLLSRRDGLAKQPPGKPQRGDFSRNFLIRAVLKTFYREETLHMNALFRLGCSCGCADILRWTLSVG
jgi:hypothetical protein